MVKALLITALAAQATAYAIGQRGEEIVGGKDTDIKDVPYQIQFDAGGAFCGGSIINKNTILTAGHCVEGGSASDFSIKVGNSALDKGTTYQVSEVFQHPKYNGQIADYDAAILKLTKSIKFGPGVQAVAGLADKEPAVGDIGLVSGWGTEGEKNPDLASTLQSVQVPVIDRAQCAKMYQSGSYHDTVTDRMFCASVPEGGKDSCSGDSGGPFIVNGKLAGIVSWGEGCARADAPGVYGNIAQAEMHDFITSHL
ncbi:hypothetical protein VHEMI01331 [[Torrubiella] hemipterigena]|uniref:Peptidase S1 domain-containing protein n=1 Tax=[Torrubiella] hemipterigena TaxID=1531966 RepID=A0A0A1T4H6_9HYPO|nr:hypothetical protein VHEMI01331 [[Torrubiella] hemipterigena]